ncbi:MAG: hypothetical protein R3E68_05055 [Burkholderiaceae bacterium]
MGTAAAQAPPVSRRNNWVIVTTPIGTLRARARLSTMSIRDRFFAQHGWWVPLGDEAGGGGPRQRRVNPEPT